MPVLVTQVGFVLLTALLVGMTRRRRRHAARESWSLGWLAPVGWTWAGLIVLTLTFAEQAGQPLSSTSTAKLSLYSIPILLTLPIALVPRTARHWVAGIAILAASLVILADLAYFRYFGAVLPWSALAAIGQLWSIRQSIQSLWHPGDASILWIAVAALLFLASFHSVRVPLPPSRRALLLGSVIGLVMYLSAGLALLEAVRQNMPVLTRVLVQQAPGFPDDVLLRAGGVFSVHILDGLVSIHESLQSSKLSPRDRQRVMRFFAAHIPDSAPPSPEPTYGIAHGKNVLLIQLESMSQSVIGLEVEGQEITPFLNRLRHRALYFPYLFDQTFQGRTSDCEFVVLNSLYPLRRGAVSLRRPYNEFVTLPGVLRQAGYATLSAHAFLPSFWNRGVVHPRYGFERSLFKQQLGPGESMGWGLGLADGVFFARMVPELTRLPRPFCALLIGLGLHDPFDHFPAAHKILRLGSLEQTQIGNYLHAQRYVDQSLEEFFVALEHAALLRHTLIAIYGDHSPGFNAALLSQKWVGEAFGYPKWEPWSPAFHVRMNRVPLFFVIPGQPPLVGEQPVFGGEIDIAPTVLHLLGIPPPRTFLGRSLITGQPHVVALPRPWGSAVTPERILFAHPSQPACVAFASGDPLPDAACRDVAVEAREQLEISELVVLHNLAASVAASEASLKPQSPTGGVNSPRLESIVPVRTWLAARDGEENLR